MRSIRCRKQIFYVLYVVMTLECIFLGCLFSEYRHFVLLAWYFITAAIWIMLMIEVIALWIKLQKMRKLFNERGKE